MVSKKQLEADINALSDYVEKQFYKISNNGVAKAIEKLNKEVIAKKDPWEMTLSMYPWMGKKKQPTLVEKVDAIIEFLDIKISVNEAEEYIEVKSKKLPKTAKKGKK